MVTIRKVPSMTSSFHLLQLLKWLSGLVYMPNGTQGKDFEISFSFEPGIHGPPNPDLNLNFRFEILLRTPENLDNQIARQLRTQMDNTRL